MKKALKNKGMDNRKTEGGRFAQERVSYYYTSLKYNSKIVRTSLCTFSAISCTF